MRPLAAASYEFNEEPYWCLWGWLQQDRIARENGWEDGIDGS